MRSFAGILLLLTIPAFVMAQDNRRDREEPELVVESGGRTGPCDALAFSDDGAFLFAAGDDKVVRVWPNGKDGIDSSKMQTLRWPSWREQRGGIKALAVSPDGKRVAVGGFGLRSSTVAVINRLTGEVEELTYPESAQPGENFFAVMTTAFSPDGKAVAFGTGDGSVWVWTLGQKPRRVGKNLPKGTPFNRVRLVAFVKEGIFSVFQNGQVRTWNPGSFETTVEGTPLPNVFRAALSRDGVWLAAGGNDHEFVVYNRLTGAKKSFKVESREFIRAVAFNNDAGKLAVAVGRVPADSRFSIDADDRILLFDQPTEGELKPTPGPASRYRVDALVFDPTGRLAVAGGDNHDVVLWDLNQKDPLSVAVGSGRNLWGVRVSAAGTSVGFQTERDAVAVDPNKRGKGPYAGYDLTRGRPLKGAAEWVEPLETLNGWTVEPDKGNRFVWWAVNADKKLRYPLALNPDRDEAPRCYTFLKSLDGGPTRLVVGHYYGGSLFDLTEKGATRHQVLVGHAGEVMSVAPSKDGSWFATCGTDQTVAGWSAEDWKYQAQFGAEVAIENGKLLVKAVDTGSPAWEMGLIEGDEIVLMVIGAGPPLFNQSGKYEGRYGPQKGNPEDCLAYLRNPVPGRFLHLGWKRGKSDKVLEQLTSMPRRPLWRLFPSFDKSNAMTDWIVWMWKTSCYHTSTNGDFLVGWHVNHPSLDGTPKFYRAEQFREHFNKPQVVLPLLTDRKLDEAIKRAQKGTNFSALEPAPVTIEPRNPVVGPNGLELTVRVNQRGANPDLLPERVDLWVNDFRFESWQPGEKKFEQKVVIPADKLRDGSNQLTLQTFNRLGGRGEAVAMTSFRREQQAPSMIGLFVGVNDYKKSKAIYPDPVPVKKGDGVVTKEDDPNKAPISAPPVSAARAFGDLASAVNDAVRLNDRWLQHSGLGKLFREGTTKKYLDTEAKRQDILDELDIIAKKAKPDDFLILFLAGHGDYIRPVAPKGQAEGPGIFVFCCPEYDRKNHAQTGITSEALIEKLSRIPCRKLVLLDACHSGEAASTNLIRHMAPTGKGVTVIAACDQQEQAFEHEKFKNGLFTYAVMEALGDGFTKADANGDGRLTPDELFRYVRARLPELLKEAGKDEFDQNPICFPREPEKFPIGGRAK